MTDTPYYELRLYRCVSGRIPDLHKRMTQDVPPLFAANGIPQPLIYWTGYVGPRAPLYAYLLRWDDLDARMSSFARFYQYPLWLAHRTESNSGREMVDRIDVFILRPNGPVSDFSQANAPEHSLHEIRLQQVLSRDSDAAFAAWNDHDLPLLERHGCRSLGSFSMWYGTRMPQIVSLLTWTDFESRMRALSALDATNAADGVRHAERKRFGRPLFDRTEVHLVKRAV